MSLVPGFEPVNFVSVSLVRLAILATVLALAGYGYYLSDGRVPTPIAILGVAVLVPVWGVTGVGLWLAPDRPEPYRWLVVAMVPLPMAVVAGALWRWSAFTRLQILATTAAVWGVSLLSTVAVLSAVALAQVPIGEQVPDGEQMPFGEETLRLLASVDPGWYVWVGALGALVVVFSTRFARSVARRRPFSGPG